MCYLIIRLLIKSWLKCEIMYIYFHIVSFHIISYRTFPILFLLIFSITVIVICKAVLLNTKWSNCKGDHIIPEVYISWSVYTLRLQVWISFWKRKYACLQSSVLYCPVWAETLQWTSPPLKKSYQVSQLRKVTSKMKQVRQ